MDISKYKNLLPDAIRLFWSTRFSQKEAQNEKEIKDTGNRSSVTGGKQLDGILELLYIAAKDVGIPEKFIHIKRNQLPGFFRPTKDWDLLIVTPKNKLISVIELKSQVGSFGNNFNNRTEEALGSATDLWTAYREKAFPDQAAPWLGYFMLVERSEVSERPVRVSEPFFKVLEEFKSTSYLDRYKLFCQKLMLERLYTQCCLLWVKNDYSFGDIEESISFDNFFRSFIGHLLTHLHEFESTAS